VKIRSQLLLVGLSTLVLPWAGCQYARELETTLRASQEQSLLASAGTIANALSAEPDRVFRDPADTAPFDAGKGDLYVFPLARTPLLDGYRADWDVAQEPVPITAANAMPLRLQLGVTDRYVYLYAEVTDPHFEPEPGDVHPDRDRFDRLDLVLEQADGVRDAYFFATAGQGLAAAQTWTRDEDGVRRAGVEPRIQGFWLQTTAGYHLEARIPAGMVGVRLGIRAVDGADGTSAANPAAIAAGRLFFAPRGLDALLATFVRSGTRATVVDGTGLKFGAAGALDAEPDGSQDPDLGRAWFRQLMAVDNRALPERSPAPDRLAGTHVDAALAGRPGAAWLRTGRRELLLLAAAAPIVIEGRTRGAVILEQAGDQLVGLRDRALTRLFDSTLLAMAIAMAFVFGFATWLGVRIGRLQEGADSAIGADGRIRLQMPEAASSDELGALSRSFERLLARLDEHTQYLRTLGGKLSHELRTPLTIVRSSLDNLESGELLEEQRTFVRRAREGSVRLQSILSALGAAARVEESIKQAERTHFDLGELLASAIAGYRSGFPRTQFAADLPAEPCPVRGAPDLIVQMLDKLVENAVDFCPPDGVIGVSLARSAGDFELRVVNDGPRIPDELMGRLFESLIERRSGADERPHFGLGLYIARLIVEFHGGRVSAENREAATGVVFTVRLPMI
jgi:signal transduction histidine kinase